jgi:hypothetical protein
MNASNLARHFDRLNPKERFALILSAEARDDDDEADRLADSAGRITLSMRDFAPHLQAFHELETLVFCEFLEGAAAYEQAMAIPDCLHGEEETTEEEPKSKSAWQRRLDLALAAGFMLKTKEAGWRLFCERQGVPPHGFWRNLPGWERLQRSLKMAEEAAFVSTGMLRWLNSIRPAGAPELEELGLTAEGFADSLSELFLAQVTRFSGRN